MAATRLITAEQLEACRKQFLSTRPTAAINALARVTVARVMETNGKATDAFDNLEQALRLDPLNLRLHLARTRALRLQKLQTNGSAASLSASQ